LIIFIWTVEYLMTEHLITERCIDFRDETDCHKNGILDGL